MIMSTNYIREIPEKEQDAAIKALFQKVFGTPDGALALAIILDDLFWSRPTENDEQVSLRNYALVLMKNRVGITRNNLATVVAMFNTKGE